MGRPFGGGLGGKYCTWRVHRYMGLSAHPSKLIEGPATHAANLALSLSKGGPRVPACFDELSTVLEPEAPDPLPAADAQISGPLLATPATPMPQWRWTKGRARP